MQPVLSTNFQLQASAENPARAVVESACSMISAWVEQKYLRSWKQTVSFPFVKGEYFPLEGHRLFVGGAEAEDAEIKAFHWRHPHDTDNTLDWITSITLARHQEAVGISASVKIATNRAVLRPVSFDIGFPRVLKEIIRVFPASIGGWMLPATIQRVGPAEIEPFVADCLFNPTRALPVVVVSPDVASGYLPVSPEVVFERLGRLAHVAVLPSKWSAYKLTDVVGKTFSCFGGAVRLYWPGCQAEDNPLQHPLFFPNQLRDLGGNGRELGSLIFAEMAKYSAFRFHEEPVHQLARTQFEDASRNRLKGILEEHNAGKITVKNLQDELFSSLEKIERLEAEKKQLTEDLEAQQRSWLDYQRATPSAATQEQPADAEQGAPRFASVEAALRQAIADFSGPGLKFLESASKSAENSPYQDPEAVYHFFESLWVVANEWHEKRGKLGVSFDYKLRTEYGFDVHNVSETTINKWKSDYTFQYKGKKVVFEDHVTLGAKQAHKCISIHWYKDDADFTVVVGHCGRHLTNTRT